MIHPAQLALESVPMVPIATSASHHAVLLPLHEEASIPFLLQERPSSEI